MLFESEDTDRAARAEARKVFLAVHAYLEANTGWLDEVLLAADNKRHGNGFVVRGVRAGLPDDLVLFLTPPNKHGVEAGLSRTETGFVMVLSILLAPGSVKHLATRFRSGGERLFTHEFMHYLLSKRTEGRTSSSSAARQNHGLADYFNHPEETNAFYQEAAANMESFARALGMAPPAVTAVWAQKPVSELLGMMKTKFTGEDFLKYASPSTMRAFDKRAVRFIQQTFLPMLRKETVSESLETEPKLTFNPREGVWEFEGFSVYADLVGDPKKNVGVSSFTSAESGNGNAERALRWLKQKCRRVGVYDPGAPDTDSYGFWKRMVEKGLIDWMEDEDGDPIDLSSL